MASVYSRRRVIAQAVSRGLLTADSKVHCREVHVGFVVDKVALGQVILRLLRFSSVNFPPMLHYFLMYHLGDGQWAL
jgi:hypothetical protein